MKKRSIMAGLLTAAVCFSMMSACTNTENTKQTSSDSETSQTSEEKKNSENEKSSEESVEEDTVNTDNLHKLYIRDTAKNSEITVTFVNTENGNTKDVKLTKSAEDSDSTTFSCEEDVTLFNMVHVSYGEKTSNDVAFNKFVSGWNIAEDRLLPYIEGKKPVYDPKFETKTFKFDNIDRKVYVWTPEDYDKDSKDKYSVIYTFDGQTVLATGVDRGMDNDDESWNVSESVESMMAQSDYKAILVCIDNSVSRDDDLVPDLGSIYFPEDMPEDIKAKLKEEDISKKRGNDYADFICDTIVPYINENYNVYTDPQHTSLVGSSLGGLMTFYTVLAHPDVFGTGGVYSATLSMYSNDQWADFISDKIKMENAPLLYFYNGGYLTDNGNCCEPVYNMLIKDGYPKDKLIFNKNEWGEHLIKYWRGIMPEFYEAAFTGKVTALGCSVPVEYSMKVPNTMTMDDISFPEDDTRSLEVKSYIYYDNSETKWDKVYAYWWTGYPIDATGKVDGLYFADWPGVEMERIEGTDIYRLGAPLGIESIIFDSGVTDDKVAKGETAYQTSDLSFDTSMVGKVYKIDMSVDPKQGKGIEKTKFVYQEGAWSVYNPES